MKIKKLNTLFLLAALLTTGGVYASWNYATGNLTSSAQTEAKVQIGLGSTSTKGTLDIISSETNIVATVLNKKENDVYTYKTDLLFTGNITIKFTPAAYADEDVIKNGIKLKVTISEDFPNYVYGNDNIDLFKFVDADENARSATYILKNENPILNKYVILGEVEEGVTEDNPATTDRLENKSLGALVEMAEVKLDTKEKFDKMKETLSQGKFTITIEEVVDTPKQ